MPPPDPLAELQAQHALHRERHDALSTPCTSKHCRSGRWLSLCDRLAAAEAQMQAERDEARKQAAYEAANADKFEQRLSAINHGKPNNIHCRCSHMWGIEQERSAALARDLEAAEHDRDQATTALEDSEKLLASATQVGQQILDRLHGLEAALAIAEFGNQILPPAISDQDRCVRCDALRAEGHAGGCRLAAALSAQPATEGE